MSAVEQITSMLFNNKEEIKDGAYVEMMNELKKIHHNESENEYVVCRIKYKDLNIKAGSFVRGDAFCRKGDTEKKECLVEIKKTKFDEIANDLPFIAYENPTNWDKPKRFSQNLALYIENTTKIVVGGAIHCDKCNAPAGSSRCSCSRRVEKTANIEINMFYPEPRATNGNPAETVVCSASAAPPLTSTLMGVPATGMPWTKIVTS